MEAEDGVLMAYKGTVKKVAWEVDHEYSKSADFKLECTTRVIVAAGSVLFIMFPLALVIMANEEIKVGLWHQKNKMKSLYGPASKAMVLRMVHRA